MLPNRRLGKVYVSVVSVGLVNSRLVNIWLACPRLPISLVAETVSQVLCGGEAGRCRQVLGYVAEEV